MALTPDDDEMITLALEELSEVTANNRILEAECVQLKEFLDESLRELAEARSSLSAALEKNRNLEKKLSFHEEEKGIRKSAWAVRKLRSELRQSLSVMAAAEQSLTDLAILSSTALGLQPDAPSTIAPVIITLQSFRADIEKTLAETIR